MYKWSIKPQISTVNVLFLSFFPSKSVRHDQNTNTHQTPKYPQVHLNQFKWPSHHFRSDPILTTSSRPTLKPCSYIPIFAKPDGALRRFLFDLVWFKNRFVSLPVWNLNWIRFVHNKEFELNGHCYYKRFTLKLLHFFGNFELAT